MSFDHQINKSKYCIESHTKPAVDGNNNNYLLFKPQIGNVWSGVHDYPLKLSGDTVERFVSQHFILIRMSGGVERGKQSQMGWGWHAKRPGVSPSMILILYNDVCFLYNIACEEAPNAYYRRSWFSRNSSVSASRICFLCKFKLIYASEFKNLSNELLLLLYFFYVCEICLRPLNGGFS